MTHNPQSPANTPPDNAFVSSTPDERIDQVLAGLRKAEPAAGIEARLLNRIQAHLAEARVAETAAPAPATTPSATAAPSIYAAVLNAIKPSRLFSSPTYRHAFAATSLAAVAAVSILAVHSHHAAPSQTSASIVAPPVQTIASVEGAGLQSRRMHTTTSAALAAEAPGPGRPAPATAATAAVEPHLQPHHQPHVESAALALEAPTASQPSTDPDAIALAETLAPSHPAPPMPLTEQERLLMAVARTGDREEMTALNPVQREALYKQDQEAFQKFFAPPALQKPILEAKNGATNDPHTDTR
ncbi:MAG: hypothetical protein HIU91_00380 [Acidobacteria bacterium]|nr:hypothetical protein [Acidobacteriota bacterium]